MQAPRIAQVGVAFSLACFANSAEAGEPTDERIYGGTPVESCAWPSVVSMSGSCTGTLVHPEVVIYAAHCGAGFNSVTFGETINGNPGKEVATEYCRRRHVITGNGDLGGGEDVAFCKLAQPVLDVPIVPILMGCETGVLGPGRLVTAVGFGNANNGPYGVKREVEIFVSQVGAEVYAGGGGEGTCNGDSGGPLFVKLAAEDGGDDTWRVFGITSWGPEGCNNGASFGRMDYNMDWFESELAADGIDITPCHDTDGTWNPTPQCQAFPMDPGTGGGSWSGGCEMGPVGGFSGLCGAPIPMDDMDPPTGSITAPPTGTMVSSDPATGLARVTVNADAADDGWGIAEVRLMINGEVIPGGADSTEPFEWTVDLPPGQFELSALAVDWATNEAEAETVYLGVDMDPPEPPAGETGGDDAGDDAGGTSGGDDPGLDPGEKGCACAAEPGQGSGGGFALLGLLALRLRRRR
jgi:MYXO-CTERM domain-containing protein